MYRVLILVAVLAGSSIPPQARGNPPEPKLSLEVNGPKLKNLERSMKYTFTVTNAGNAAAENVTIRDSITRDLQFVEADHDGRYSFWTHSVTWSLGRLEPKQSKKVVLKLTVREPCLPNQTVTVTASDGRGGAEKAHDQLLISFRLEGLPPILIELTGSDDSVEVGGKVTYEIRITNLTGKPVADLKLACTIPECLQFENAEGPSKFHPKESEIVSVDVPKLASRDDVTYRVTCKAIRPGTAKFTIRLFGPCVEPWCKEERTKVTEPDSTKRP